jgi:hypothetical protein
MLGGVALALLLGLGAFCWLVVVPVWRLRSRGEAWKYENKQHGFSLTVPARWEVTEDTLMCAAMFRSPREGSSDKFCENVNVVIVPMLAGGDLAAHCGVELEALRTFFAGFALKERGRAPRGLPSARWLVYERDSEVGRLKHLVYFVPDGRRVFVMTATARPASFVTYRGTFESILQSFELDAEVRE